jgi:hypothetical protein
MIVWILSLGRHQMSYSIQLSWVSVAVVHRVLAKAPKKSFRISQRPRWARAAGGTLAPFRGDGQLADGKAISKGQRGPYKEVNNPKLIFDILRIFPPRGLVDWFFLKAIGLYQASIPSRALKLPAGPAMIREQPGSLHSPCIGCVVAHAHRCCPLHMPCTRCAVAHAHRCCTLHMPCTCCVVAHRTAISSVSWRAGRNNCGARTDRNIRMAGNIQSLKMGNDAGHNNPELSLGCQKSRHAKKLQIMQFIRAKAGYYWLLSRT